MEKSCQKLKHPYWIFTLMKTVLNQTTGIIFLCILLETNFLTVFSRFQATIDGKEKPGKEGRNRQFDGPVDHEDPALPTGRAVEPQDTALVDQWDSLEPQKEARYAHTCTCTRFNQ